MVQPTKVSSSSSFSSSSRSVNAMSSDREKPHFYAIIQHPTMLTQGQYPGIPQAFLREHGRSLSNSVLLHLPTGAEWRVGLLRLHGEVFFCWGWKQFADFYSLVFGHFLVFRYEGSSHFQVLIFDRTATEIKYPHATSHAQDHSHPQTANRIEMVYVTSSDEMINPNGGSSLPKVEEVQNDPPTTHETGRTRRNNPSCRPPKASSSQSHGLSVPKVRGGAPREAEAFQSDNPFFIVTMRRSYVKYHFVLNVPFAFFRSHFQSHTNTTISLVSNGRSWLVYCSRMKEKVKFSSGWKSFAQENSLKVGDMCAFELIKSSQPSFNVVIFRNNED